MGASGRWGRPYRRSLLTALSLRAGIGGLAIAYVLSKAGHRVRVLEKHGRDVPGGGHRVPPNMSKILRQWISEEELRAVSTRCVGTPFHHRESVCSFAHSTRTRSSVTRSRAWPRSHSAGTSRFSPMPTSTGPSSADASAAAGRSAVVESVSTPRRGDRGRTRADIHGARASRFTAAGERDCRMQLPGDSPRKSGCAADRVRRCALIDFIHVRRPASSCVIDRRRTLTRLPFRPLLATHSFQPGANRVMLWQYERASSSATSTGSRPSWPRPAVTSS